MAQVRNLPGRPPRGPVSENRESTPICRCRVLYLGSAVPHVTKDGLQGIQEPLRELYPEQGAVGAKGIDSWLSVWSNGLLLENVDENHKRVTRFFPIDTLHYCAAVRYVLVPASSGERIARFLPLDSPFARHPNINHPPLFACIMRRTTGIKVLECHVFICKRETASNALVRCCFHAYADSTYAHHLENGGLPLTPNGRLVRSGPSSPGSQGKVDAESALNSIEKVEGWRLHQQQGGLLHVNGSSTPYGKNGVDRTDTENNGSTSSNGMGSASVSMLILDNGSADEDISILNGDMNHKIWAPSTSGRDAVYADYGSSTMRSVRSSASNVYPTRSSRPRQISGVVPPPPPPVLLTGLDENREIKSKKKERKGKAKEEDVLAEMAPRRASSVFNFPINGSRPPPMGLYQANPQAGFAGYPLLGGRRPVNGFGPPPAYLVPVPMTVAVGGKKSKSGGLKFGTFSARGKKSKGPTPAPLMVFPPSGGPPAPLPPMMAAPPPMALGIPVPVVPPPLSMRRSSSRMTLAAEEPIYMPAATRPLSPIASYQPAHFPHEAYMLQQQYTTSDLNTIDRQQTKDKKKKVSKGKSNDSEALSAEDSSLISHSGIYRKGHLNERAFSYSIRQEHRSRSYSSLANFPPGDLREQDKKERELIQMVHDLDLSGDDLERSEVPMAMYPHHRQPR